MGKLNAATFARFLEERAAAKDGYIMGGNFAPAMRGRRE